MIFRLALIVALLFAAGQVDAAKPAKPQDVRSALLAAAAAAQKEDCKTALEIVAEQTGASGFAGLPEKVKIYFYRLGMACALEESRSDVALSYAEEGTGITGAPKEMWQARFGLEWQMKRTGDAVTTVEAMANASPEALNAMPIRSWYGVVRELKNEPDLRRRLLKVLSSQSYVPDEVAQSTDYFRKEYAVLLAEAGDKPGAATLVSLIDSPEMLMRISVDPRLRDTVPADFDARAAVERHMARMREIAAAHAGMIAPQRYVAEDLLLLGRAEEALATLEAIQPDKSDADAYSDRNDMLNWWWNSKARAYAQLGQYDQAVTAYTQGKSLDEHGQPNISQTINLSELQLRFGRPADALKTLDPVAAGKVPASPYGWMMFHGNHGCASFKTGNAEAAKADLDYMHEHDADAPGASTELQLCMEDIDGAAASMIERLESPDQQADALLDLSDYALRPAAFPMDSYEAALPTLKARDDVRAAAVRAGGTRSFNIPG